MPQIGHQGRKAGRLSLVRIALGATLAALAVGVNAPAALAEDADSASAFDSFMHTLGLRNPGSTEYEINYSERSPLVVPPNRNLPSPVAAGPPPAPNWPKDPDMRKRDTGKKKDASNSDTPYHNYALEADRALRPDELGVGKPSTVSPPPPGTPEQSNPPPAKKGLLSFDWMKKEQYATFTGEPARANLTDPPPGYLTPSPDQPYGITEAKAKYGVPTVGSRGELQR